MKYILPLNGGLNKDINPLYIKTDEGEVVARENCRIHSTVGGRGGVNVSIKGMLEVTANLPAGTNTIIGYVEDKERDSGIFFNKNSNGYDSIYVFNGTTVVNLGVPQNVLGLNTSYPIQADILGDYCVFTDNLNPPRKVKITNTSGVVVANSLSGVDAYDVQLAVRPPYTSPTIEIGSDSTKKVNKLAGKTFQFAYYYVYNDYTYSVLSPYSAIAVSNTMFSTSDNTYIDNSIGNYIVVTYNIGADNVRSVKLLAREGNIGSWFLVDEFEKNGETEFSTKEFSFYNNVARQSVYETEALALYSDVPLLAKSVLSVQNRIALGNVVKGYDKTAVDFNVAVEYETVNVDSTSTPLVVNYGTDSDDVYIGWDIPASVTAGDTFSVNIFSAYLQFIGGGKAFAFKIEYAFSYVVQVGDTQTDVVTAFYNDITSKASQITTDQAYGGTYYGVDYTVYADTSFAGGSVGIVFGQAYSATGGFYEGATDGSYFLDEEGNAFSIDTLPTGVNTYKAGSYYNVGLLLYDEYSRTSGVLGSKRVYVPFNGERAYTDINKKVKLAFTINNDTVPSWVKYYRFAVTESVNFAGVYPFITGNNTDTNIYDIYLDGQNVLAINMPTNMSYEFLKGDYLVLEYDTGSAIETTVKAIIGTRTLIDISGTDTAGFWLIVPKGTEAISDYNGALISIYRPKDEVQDLIYFEDTDTYTVSGTTMQTLSGYIDCGDAWFVERDFSWDGGSDTQVVEDFYINVDFAVRAYNKGRTVVEFDTLGQIRLQDFVWSFNYLDNTKVNGISTFNSLNRKQLDEKDGQIQTMKLVGDVVKVIQDNKETSLYVGKAQISDAEGNIQVVKSNDFIGTVYPSQTDYGSRYPQSVVRNNKDLYYWDGDRGQVIRSSANGQFPISEYGMKSEFLRIKGLLTSTSRVFAYFDVRNSEYVITFTYGTSEETWVFKEGMDRWTMKLDYTNSSGTPPNLYGSIGELSFGFLNNVWKFEQTTSYNSFFGDSKDVLIRGVLNIYPTEEKCLRALKMDSNRACDTNITSPIAVTRTVGQKSVLYAETYRGRDSDYTSAVFKNILQAGGVENLSLIHSGDDMVGKYIQLEFVDDGTTEFQLRTVTATFTVNK